MPAQHYRDIRPIPVTDEISEFKIGDKEKPRNEFNDLSKTKCSLIVRM